MPIRYENTYRAFGWLVATVLCFGSALAQESQEVEPAPLESQPEPEGGQDTSKDGAADQGQRNEPTPEKLSPSLDRIEAAIRDLIAQERAAQGQGPKDNEIRDLEAQEGMAFWAKTMFWATGAAVILTFLGIFLIWRTLHHTRRAADSAKDMAEESRKATLAATTASQAANAAVVVASKTAKRQLRAYVTTENSIWFNTGQDWCFTHHWKNTGPTPTLKTLTHVNWQAFAGEIPDDFDYPDAGHKHGNDPTVVGPGQILLTQPIYISRGDVEDPDLNVYVWGWASYRDIFTDTERHRTEFCYHVTIEHEVVSQARPRIAVGARIYGRFNGADDDCYRQPEPV